MKKEGTQKDMTFLKGTIVETTQIVEKLQKHKEWLVKLTQLPRWLIVSISLFGGIMGFISALGIAVSLSRNLDIPKETYYVCASGWFLFFSFMAMLFTTLLSQVLVDMIDVLLGQLKSSESESSTGK